MAGEIIDLKTNSTTVFTSIRKAAKFNEKDIKNILLAQLAQKLEKKLELEKNKNTHCFS